MTKLENDMCSVQIAIEESFETDKNFSSRYDYIINPHSYPQDDDYKAYAIHVRLKDQTYSAALIGDYNCWDENCAVIEGNILTILQGWEITQLDVISAKVMRTAEIDSICPNVELHRVETGYLVYGEFDITMLNDRLEKLWSFSGHDVFASSTNKPAFEIREDRICLYDFVGNYYELDFQGNVIIMRKAGAIS